MRLFLLPCYPTSAKFIIYKVFLSQIYRGKPLPIDTDGWFTHNVNDIFSGFELLGFRALNFLMMNYSGNGGALPLHLDKMGNSFGL